MSFWKVQLCMTFAEVSISAYSAEHFEKGKSSSAVMLWCAWNQLRLKDVSSEECSAQASGQEALLSVLAQTAAQFTAHPLIVLEHAPLSSAHPTYKKLHSRHVGRRGDSDRGVHRRAGISLSYKGRSKQTLPFSWLRIVLTSDFAFLSD